MEAAVEKCITPTKDHPVFVVQNMYSGFCVPSIYNDWEIRVEKQVSGGFTTSLNLTDAIKAAHEYVREIYPYYDQNVRVEVQMIDGTFDRYGDPKRIKAYSISFREAERFRII